MPEIVEADGLNFTYHKMDLRDFEIPKGRYALRIASRIILLFRKSDSESLAHQIQAGLKPRGVLYIYTFSTEDIQYITKWDELEKLEENTFYYLKYKLDFHLFSKEKHLGLFSKLKLQYYAQGLTFNRRVSRLSGVIQYVGKKLR
jgi:hypothetical protein